MNADGEASFRLRRSVSTHLVVLAVVLVGLFGFPPLGTLLFGHYWPGYLEALQAPGGIGGLVAGVIIAVGLSGMTYSSVYRVRGLELRGWGALPGRVRLDQITSATVERRRRTDSYEELMLDIRTEADCVTIRLGDNPNRSIYRPASLCALADVLDRPGSRPAAAHLRALADDGSVRSWPVTSTPMPR